MPTELTSKKYLLARLRHRIEANKRQLRMLGLRLTGEVNLLEQLRDAEQPPLAHEMAADLENYAKIAELDLTEQRIALDIPGRDLAIKELNERYFIMLGSIQNMESVFQEILSKNPNAIDEADQRLVENLMNEQFTAVHENEIDEVVDDLPKTGFFNRVAQHWTYNGATDIPYYVPVPFQLLNWVGRQLIWNTKNDGGEIRLLWTKDFSDIYNDPKRGVLSKGWGLFTQVFKSVGKTLFNVAKIPLGVVVGGPLRLASKTLDSVTKFVLTGGDTKPYQIIKPANAEVPGLRDATQQPLLSADAESSMDNPPNIKLMTSNMERFVAAVAKLTGKDVTAPAADTKENGEAINQYLEAEGEPDVICLQEMFDRGAQREMIKALQEKFPYIIHDVGAKHWPFMGSGLMILSKHPIKEVGFHRFPNALGDESLANKGLAMVRIEKEGKLFDVATTHTQAGSSLGGLKKFFSTRRRGAGSTTRRRSDQMGIMAKVLTQWSQKETGGRKPFAQVLSGDLNESFNTADKCWGLSSGKSHNTLGHIKNMGSAQLTRYMGYQMPRNFMDTKSRFVVNGLFFKNAAGDKIAVECVEDDQGALKAKVLNDNMEIELVDISRLSEREEFDGYWLDYGELQPPDGANTEFEIKFRALEDSTNPQGMTYACSWRDNAWKVVTQNDKGGVEYIDFHRFTPPNSSAYQLSGYSGVGACFQDADDNIFAHLLPKTYRKNVDPILDHCFRAARHEVRDTYNGTNVGRKYRHQQRGFYTGQGGEKLLDRVVVKPLAEDYEVEQQVDIVDSQTFSGVKEAGVTDFRSSDHHAVKAEATFRKRQMMTTQYASSSNDSISVMPPPQEAVVEPNSKPVFK